MMSKLHEGRHTFRFKQGVSKRGRKKKEKSMSSNKVFFKKVKNVLVDVNSAILKLKKLIEQHV